MWGNCIALVTQICLSINQPNQTNNQHALLRNQSQQPFQTSRNQFSLSNLPEALRKHSLSSQSLSLFPILSNSHTFLPRLNGRQLHDFTLIFFEYFFLLFLSYSLLVWASMFCLILLPLINNDLQAKLPRVYFPQIPQPISHFSISLRGSLTFQLTKCMEQQPEETRFPPSPLMVSGKHISQPREEKRTSSSSSSVTVCASQRNNSTFARFPPL